MDRIYYTPQISLPNSIKFADCKPVVQTPDDQLAKAYLVSNYNVRSAWSVYNKGPTPPPIVISTSINSNVATYSIYFNQFLGGQCPQSTCNLQCINQDLVLNMGTGQTVNTTYCANGERPAYYFTVSFTSDSVREQSPVNLSLQFTDQLLNSNTVTIQSISFIKPLTPNVVMIKDKNKSTVYIGIDFKTYNFTQLNQGDIEEFIIQKAVGSNLKSADTFIGWSKAFQDGKLMTNDNYFTDNNVSVADIVSYRIRYRNKYQEYSQWSSWVTVNNDQSVDLSWTL